MNEVVEPVGKFLVFSELCINKSVIFLKMEKNRLNSSCVDDFLFDVPPRFRTTAFYGEMVASWLALFTNGLFLLISVIVWRKLESYKYFAVNAAWCQVSLATVNLAQHGQKDSYKCGKEATRFIRSGISLSPVGDSSEIQ